MSGIKTVERRFEPGFLEKILERSPIAEEVLVERAVNFANRGTINSYFNFVSQGEREHQDDARNPGLTEGMKGDLSKFRSALTAIAEADVTSDRIATWCRHASGVLSIVSYNMVDGVPTAEIRHQVVEHFASPEPTGLFSLILVWLMDPQRPFLAKDLCQCHWRECGKFFFARAEKPKHQGKRLRRYCSHEHMKLANDAESAERVRRWRQLRAEARTKSKGSKRRK
jgi:hypothetical protein